MRRPSPLRPLRPLRPSALSARPPVRPLRPSARPPLCLSRFAETETRACACADLGVELCGQKLTWDDVRPFKLQFRMFRGRKKSGRIAPQDLVSYSLKMQEAKRRMALVRDVVKTGRSEFVAGDRRSEFAASRSSYPVLSSSAEHPTRRRKPSFLARSLDERLHHAPHAPQRSLTGEAAHQDMEIAAAKMQALVRGRTSRKNSPMLLRRGVRVAPTAEDGEEDTVEPGDGSPPAAIVRREISSGTSRCLETKSGVPPVHEEAALDGTVSLNG